MKRAILMIGIVLILCGCASGLSDYDYPVGNNYILVRSSSHEIKVIPNTGYMYEKEILPSKVVEIAWNERYVIAKQYGMKIRGSNSPDNTYEEPDKSKVYYWILDTSLNEKETDLDGYEYRGIRYGPYDYEEFQKELKSLGLTKLKLKPVEKYRK